MSVLVKRRSRPGLGRTDATLFRFDPTPPPGGILFELVRLSVPANEAFTPAELETRLRRIRARLPKRAFEVDDVRCVGCGKTAKNGRWATARGWQTRSLSGCRNVKLVQCPDCVRKWGWKW